MCLVFPSVRLQQIKSWFLLAPGPPSPSMTHPQSGSDPPSRIPIDSRPVPCVAFVGLLSGESGGRVGFMDSEASKIPDTIWKPLSRGGLASRIAEGSIIELGGFKAQNKALHFELRLKRVQTRRTDSRASKDEGHILALEQYILHGSLYILAPHEACDDPG